MLAAFALLLALIGAITVWVGRSAHRLATGKTATVRTIERCATDVVRRPAAHCGSEWVFPDGRTGHGKVSDPPVVVGDKIFAGKDWAYTSSSPLHRSVWLPGSVLCLLTLGTVALAISYRIDTRPQPPAPTPPSGQPSPTAPLPTTTPPPA